MFSPAASRLKCKNISSVKSRSNNLDSSLLNSFMVENNDLKSENDRKVFVLRDFCWVPSYFR